jgi:hypothetical protein
VADPPLSQAALSGGSRTVNTPTLYTAQDAAAILGVSPRRVRALARSRRLGSMLGPLWVFSERDLEGMRIRVPGRPRVLRS